MSVNISADEGANRMTINVLCPHCSRAYRASRDFIGRRSRCKCGRVFVIRETKDSDVSARSPDTDAANTRAAPVASAFDDEISMGNPRLAEAPAGGG